MDDRPRAGSANERNQYRCPGLDTPGPGTTDGLWRFQNETGQSINLIVDHGGPDPSFAGALANGATHDETAPFTGDHIVFSAQQEDRRIVTIEAFSFHRDNDCHIQLQVVATPSSPL